MSPSELCSTMLELLGCDKGHFTHLSDTISDLSFKDKHQKQPPVTRAELCLPATA